MTFNWREFLIVAHKLSQEADEGSQRASLGRTYYYVYNLGLIEARTKGFTGKVPGLHYQLWNWYQMHKDPDLQKIGTYGSRMKSLRHDADYRDVPIKNLSTEVARQISNAQKIENLIAARNKQAPHPPL
jgi:hypothetical protein